MRVRIKIHLSAIPCNEDFNYPPGFMLICMYIVDLNLTNAPLISFIKFLLH